MVNGITLVGMLFAVTRFGFIGPEWAVVDDKTSYQYQVDQKNINWIKWNISPETGMPLSFYIPPEFKGHVYAQMGKFDSVPDIIERVIVEEGLVIYDGAVSQMVMTLLGGQNELRQAERPIEVYWEGALGSLANIRAGYPISNFIYDPDNPSAVSSDLSDEGFRGFVFRIINAHGKYNTSDPLDGKTQFKDFPTWPTVHWEDWKPVAGENAWITMAALQLYHKKYFDPVSGKYAHNPDSVELKLAREIARAALILQTDVGGIRMGPIGAYRKQEDLQGDTPQGEWWYRQISSENNISWYSAFRMLYQITKDPVYKKAMDRIESYFKSVWNKEKKYFYQGMNFSNGQWHFNDEHFALDVQTWALACFGPETIDEWFGTGTAYYLWRGAKERSGFRSAHGQLLGVGYIAEHDRLSVEWTAGAVLAALEIAEAYDERFPQWADEVRLDAIEMRRGIDLLKFDLNQSQSAYSYSSRRGWIPFGWNSHSPEVLSLASTGWVVLVDAGYNPFYLPNRNLSKNELAVLLATE